MLECWQEDAGKRPTFSQLKAQFESMLLAENKETYIDLQIDTSKPYYQPEGGPDSNTKPGNNNPNLQAKPSGHKSPFHATPEKSPSHSNFSGRISPSAATRGERSPRSLSPVPPQKKQPRPRSLQLTEPNANHYVEDPAAARRSLILSPLERSEVSDGDNLTTTQVEYFRAGGGNSDEEGVRGGEKQQGDTLELAVVPVISISLSS